LDRVHKPFMYKGSIFANLNWGLNFKEFGDNIDMAQWIEIEYRENATCQNTLRMKEISFTFPTSHLPACCVLTILQGKTCEIVIGRNLFYIESRNIILTINSIKFQSKF